MSRRSDCSISVLMTTISCTLGSGRCRICVYDEPGPEFITNLSQLSSTRRQTHTAKWHHRLEGATCGAGAGNQGKPGRRWAREKPRVSILRPDWLERAGPFSTLEPPHRFGSSVCTTNTHLTSTTERSDGCVGKPPETNGRGTGWYNTYFTTVPYVRQSGLPQRR